MVKSQAMGILLYYWGDVSLDGHFSEMRFKLILITIFQQHNVLGMSRGLWGKSYLA